MRDFWFSCGHHLVDRDEDGRLVVTDALLKAYLARPELAPEADACATERALHAALMVDPFRAVAPDEIATIVDADARENWQLMIAFRDRLLRHGTLEAAYLDLVRRGVGRTPPLFLDQLVQLILRNALDGCADGLVLRAAELFFRPQILTVHEGALLAADEEIVGHGAPVSPLVSMLGLPVVTALPVIGAYNANEYFERSDAFDMAIDLTAGRDGLRALGEVILAWLRHLQGIEARIEALIELRDVALHWYVGLDSDGTAIGDALWRGDAIDQARASQLLGLWRLDIIAPATGPTGGEPIYLIMAMGRDRRLRMKPQNLIVGLPVEAQEAVS